MVTDRIKGNWVIVNSRGKQVGKKDYDTRKKAQQALEKRITSPIARTQFSVEQLAPLW